MRGIIWLVVLAISAVAIAWLLSNNQGHVTLYWQTYRIDLSMNLFILLSFSSFFVFFNFFKMIALFIELPARALSYRQKQVELGAFRALQEAIEHLFAGRYLKSLKSVQAAHGFAGTAQMAYMIAAQASHHLKQYKDRDDWLEKIQDERYQTTKLILNAQMLIDERDALGALQSLGQIQKSGARQFLVQALAMRAHQILQQWPQMLRIADSLLKKNVLPPVLGKARIHEALTQWMRSGKISRSDLLLQWQDFDEESKKNPQWIKLFAQGFLNVGDSDFAKKILDRAIEQESHEDVLMIYPQCALHPLAKTPHVQLIQMLEGWLKKEPAHPGIHLALGQLCMGSQLWGKSIASFQHVVDSTRASKKMVVRAHFGMLSIYETLENHEKSAEQQKHVLRLLLELHPLN